MRNCSYPWMQVVLHAEKCNAAAPFSVEKLSWLCMHVLKFSSVWRKHLLKEKDGVNVLGWENIVWSIKRIQGEIFKGSFWKVGAVLTQFWWRKGIQIEHL